MELQPGESVGIFVRRNHLEPFDYAIIVRKSDAFFADVSHDLCFQGAQEAIFNLETKLNIDAALDSAVSVIERLKILS